MKKNKKQNISIAVIGIVIITAIIVYNYSADQTKQKGFQFGNNSKGPYANNMITCHAYVFGAFYKPFRFPPINPMFDPIAKYNNHTIVK